MMTRRDTTLIWTLVLLLMLMAGCSEDTDNTITENQATRTDDYENMDFSMTYGGLTASDEEVAFDQVDLQLEAAEDDMGEFADVWADDEEVREYEERARRPEVPGQPDRAQFTFLRIKWGQFDAQSDLVSDDVLDWTGELSVDRGIVVVRRIIRFERPYDHIVLPRLDRHTVNWVSRTGPHYDGILIQIIEPPADRTASDDDPNYLHFRTARFEQSFLVSELAETDQIFEVDELGNGVQFCGFSLTDISLCPKGFLSARWEPASDAQPDSNGNIRMGHFQGRWVGLHGSIQGFLRGSYGLTSTGEHIFIGKYISRTGQFRGFLRGNWESDEDNETMWTGFRGHWIGANEVVEGVIGGRCFNVPGRDGGFLEGRWATNCDEDAVAQLQ